MAIVQIAAIMSNDPPSTQLSSRSGSYSQIFVMWVIMARLARLTMWLRHLKFWIEHWSDLEMMWTYSNWFSSVFHGSYLHWACSNSIVSQLVLLFSVLSNVMVYSWLNTWNQLSYLHGDYQWSYLQSFFSTYTHVVTQPHEVASQIPPTMFSWYPLETNYFWPQLPLSILHLNPVCCHPKKWCLCIVGCPSICGSWDFTWGHLSKILWVI